MKKTLLIDDIRTPIVIMNTYGIQVDEIATNYFSGIEALKSQQWDTLCLDHDLATWDDQGNEKTGHDVMKWLEQNPEFMPEHIVYVSANPVGVQNMRAVERSIRKRMEEDK